MLNVEGMNELDEVWRQMISEAVLKAKATGRGDVAEYLALKANNDAIRAAGCRWLFDSLLELSAEANKKGVKIEIENEDPHRFAAAGATMVGSLLQFRRGVRSLTVEAGWTRTPADGFMRGNALARAGVTHFGIGKASAELLLARADNNLPQWFALQPDGARKVFSANDLREHFNLFLDQI